MSDSQSGAAIYPRLCVAYFMQFAIWGSWAGALGGYAGTVLQMHGWQVGWLYAAIPLGAVISPMFIGPLADRFFPAQRVVSFLHLIGGLCLIACGYFCSTMEPGKANFPLMMTLILLSGVCFMPTIALVNSIVFKHLPNSSSAPYVFVFGTIGWICVNLFIAAFCGGEKSHQFFYVGGIIGVVLSLYALTLPNTPPKGAPAPGEKSDALGLGALKLFKDPTFAIFAICAFLASIPACNYFFAAQVNYLTQCDFPSPIALTTLNQFSEIAFMAALPLFIAKIGLKNVLLLGISAWSVRYVLFAQCEFSLAIIGLLLHGFCYTFLYSASYMFADKKAPPELKASVQSLMAFLLLGVGQVLGSGVFYGQIYDNVAKPAIGTMSIAASEDPVALPTWNAAPDENQKWVQYLDLGGNVKKMMSKEEKAPEPHFGDIAVDGAISRKTLEDLSEPLKYGNTVYDKESLLKVFDEVVSTEKITDGKITRKNWLKVQTAKWDIIWYFGAAWIAVFFFAFLVLGKDPGAETVEEAKKEELETVPDHPANG